MIFEPILQLNKTKQKKNYWNLNISCTSKLICLWIYECNQTSVTSKMVEQKRQLQIDIILMLSVENISSCTFRTNAIWQRIVCVKRFIIGLMQCVCVCLFIWQYLHQNKWATNWHKHTHTQWAPKKGTKKKTIFLSFIALVCCLSCRVKYIICHMVLCSVGVHLLGANSFKSVSIRFDLFYTLIFSLVLFWMEQKQQK